MNTLQKKITKQITGNVIIVAIVFLFITSCEEIPTVETDAVINIERTSATGGGKVLDDGNADVSVRGVCWGTNQSPTIANSKTVDGSGIGTFTSSISQLTPGTLYYVKAYASNSKGTAYGNEVSFTTGQVIAPTLTTTVVTSITLTTAVSGGDITADGGGTVTARGVCWSIAGNPEITDSHTTDGTGTGSFTSNLAGLAPGTQYYVRAYSTNSAGTAYGNKVQFTTRQSVIPTLTTTEATSITSTAAMSGGNISDDGGSAVTARGVCWATTVNPTISNSKTIDGTGTGLFTSNISGLSPCTTYHIRAYATNSKGTAYGSDIPFTTNTVIPTINMNAASNIGSSTATLSGTVNANGSPTSVSFEYGISTSFGSTIAATPSQVTGTSNTSVSAVITGLIPNTQYYYRIKTVICGGTTYGLAQNFITFVPIPINGLVGYYPFNGNTNDESGNGNHGTLLSGATLTTDKNGFANKACSVNPGYVRIADNNSLDLVDFTLSIWFKPEQVGSAFNCLLGKNYTIAYAIGFDSGLSGDCPAPLGTNRPMRVYAGYHVFYFSASNFTCGSNTWYHTAITYNNSTGVVQLYVNGSFIQSGLIAAGSIGNSTDPLAIGKDGLNGDKFTGDVDEVCIYNRVLSQTEVSQLYVYY
jgi:hypothetical protein